MEGGPPLAPLTASGGLSPTLVSARRSEARRDSRGGDGTPGLPDTRVHGIPKAGHGGAREEQEW